MDRMTGERTYPVLPCADLDDALVFYTALGFTVSFHQRRPYPCAVVELDDIAIHLFAMVGFDPATSYGSAIITVAEPGERHEAFKAGLRERFGKVPIKGIPRLLPPRRKGRHRDRVLGRGCRRQLAALLPARSIRRRPR